MEVTDAFLEGVEETVEIAVAEESTKNNMDIVSNDGELHDMQVTDAFLEGTEEIVASDVVVAEEEELKENMDVFVETEGDDSNAQEPELENDNNTNVSPANEKYTMMEVLMPSSSDKQTRMRTTPSRPLCAADVDNHSPLPPTQDQQSDRCVDTVFSAIEQEAMVEEEEGEEEDEDKENVEQQHDEQEEDAEVPVFKVKTTKSSSSSGGQAVKRLSSLYLPTKSTLARARDAEANESSTVRPSNTNANPFSGSQSLKSAMSNTGRSVASAASSTVASTSRMNYARSASYRSPQTQGMCKGPRHNNNGSKKPPQQHVRRGPTIPVTPHFRSDARSKMHYKERPLTTEEREIAAIEIARKMEELRMKKTKKVGCGRL